MSLLRLSIYVFCWVMTLNLAQCADLTLWKYSTPLSRLLRRVGISPTVNGNPRQALTSDGELTAVQSGESYRDRTSEKPLDSNAFFQDQSGKRFLGFNGSRRKFEESKTFDNNPGTSFRADSAMKHSLSKRHLISKSVGSVLEPAQSYGSTVGILAPFFSYLRSKLQFSSPRIFSPTALSRSHRKGHHQEAAAPFLCKESSIGCSPTQVLELEVDTREIKKSGLESGSRGSWPSSYLLGGAMGRR
ncbi:hypothetical protein RRG08_014076 [Elysia crispata]|uniref:Uncharacterized protein n=1 Tax=Elysia crispata TaxID=231223 RepID=A0AAE0ZZB0_9GAST|nr:hypothetical protein RRG08_014076 [Elysia crispata]